MVKELTFEADTAMDKVSLLICEHQETKCASCPGLSSCDGMKFVLDTAASNTYKMVKLAVSPCKYKEEEDERLRKIGLLSSSGIPKAYHAVSIGVHSGLWEEIDFHKCVPLQSFFCTIDEDNGFEYDKGVIYIKTTNGKKSFACWLAVSSILSGVALKYIYLPLSESIDWNNLFNTYGTVDRLIIDHWDSWPLPEWRAEVLSSLVEHRIATDLTTVLSVTKPVEEIVTRISKEKALLEYGPVIMKENKHAENHSRTCKD